MCAPEAGPYKSLASINDNGFAYPFGRLNLDDPANWTMQLIEHQEQDKTIDNPLIIKALRSIRFRCTGTDVSTPDIIVRIMKDETAAYASGAYATDGYYGLQNQEFGYIEPSGIRSFIFFLVIFLYL